jgi:hypothetical protein
MFIILQILDIEFSFNRIAPNFLAPHQFCVHNACVLSAGSHSGRSTNLSPPPSSFGGLGATFRGCAFFWGRPWAEMRLTLRYFFNKITRFRRYTGRKPPRP